MSTLVSVKLASLLFPGRKITREHADQILRHVYTNGRCHLFALAAHEITGHAIECSIVLRQGKVCKDDSQSPNHSYVLLNDDPKIVLDVYGARTYYEMWKCFCRGCGLIPTPMLAGEDMDFFTIDPQQIKAEMAKPANQSCMTVPLEGEMELLHALILEMFWPNKLIQSQ